MSDTDFPEGLGHPHLEGPAPIRRHASPLSLLVLGSIVGAALFGAFGGHGLERLVADGEGARLDVQEIRVRRESVAEQFAATHFELEALHAALPPEAAVATWEQNLAETAEKIERLGSVNLAAIEEFKEQSERKEYLDRQFADLTEALNTLETAIRITELVHAGR